MVSIFPPRATAFAGLLLLLLSASPLPALSVLLIGGGTTASSEADDAVMTFLQDRYGAENVSYLQANVAVAGDELGFDALLISSTVSSSAVRGKFHTSTVPVLNWESVITDNGAGEFGVTTRFNETETNHTIRITAAHEITAGFTIGQVVPLVSGSEIVFWSVAPEASGVTHLAEDDDTDSNKFLSVVEQGATLMSGEAAPARRVMFGLKDGTFSELTAAGRTLFGQAVDWAGAGAIVALPPSVVNLAATNVEASAATIGGEVTDTGGVAPNVTLYWGDNDGGTNAGDWDGAIEFGAESGAFSAGISSLTPGTTYYFRSLAQNAGGEAWATSTASFITGALPSPPGVVNLAATEITFTTAVLNGTVTSTGGETPNVTIYFGESDGGTIAGNWDDAVSLGAQGAAFANNLFALAAGRTYYFRAFAENSGGGTWSPESESFATAAYSAPVVVTEAASEITGTAARLAGMINSTGGDAPAVSLFWGDNDGGIDPLAWDQEVQVGEKSAGFSTVVSGLSPLTTYYVRAFARNAGGEAWGSTTVLFTTSEGSDLVINEFMAANDGGQTNNANSWWPIANQVQGSTDDWIEIHNTGPAQADLGGWHLTDNRGDPAQWTFPPGTLLGSGDFLVVYASGRDAPDAKGNLHTNFALSAGGEYVALVSPSGSVVSEFGPGGSSYPPQDEDGSYGLHPNTNAVVYFDAPTPGAPNDPAGVARVADTKFSPDRGYYGSEIRVTITSATPGARIYYTRDGTSPLNDNGTRAPGAVLYQGPILVDETQPIRAAATAQGLRSSDVDCHTYILLDLENAAEDGRDPFGLNTKFLSQRMPQGWAPLTTGDYNMDPEVTQSTTASRGHNGLSVAQAMLKGMRDLPTVSIAMNRGDFAGGNGIYTNSQSRGFAWERDCSAEFIPAEGDWRTDWGENCGLRVQGGASRIPDRSPKHSLSFRFRASYGAGKLRENLFPDSEVSEFNVIALRAGYNNSWIHSSSDQRQVGSMIRDQWARETMYEMGHPDAGRGFMVHLFINGLYWGVHNLCERQDASHYAAHNGGDEDALDARNGSDVIDGNSTAWNAMKSAVASRSWTRIQRVLDVDTYIDYQIVNRFGGNGDLKTNGNWRAAGGGPYPTGEPLKMAPWKLFSWDGERILESPTSTTDPLDPMGIRSSLDSTPEYRVRFADRLQKHFFNEGALTPSACRARWAKFATPLDRAIIAESARWGDHRRNQPYTRGSEWLLEQRRLYNNYFPVRTANVIARYRSQGFYPAFDAPTFEIGGSPQHGGVIPGGGELTIRGTGTVYYTIDGSDPRLEGGAINPRAISVASGTEVSLPASALVRVRTRQGTTWSALEEADFYLEPLATPADLRIEEINYHPAPASAIERASAAALPEPHDLSNADLFEFIELRNVSDHAINLDGVRFENGIDFTFGNVVLGAGAYVVVVKDPVAFSIRYSAAASSGVFTGNLDNEGERIALVVKGGDLVHDFSYDDDGDWPFRADGVGSSLEIATAEGDYQSPGSWRPSSEYHGTPGAAGSGPDGRVVINEVRSHSTVPVVDEIELSNRSGSAVDISGWLLADSSREFKSFVVPDATVIDDGDYALLDESDFNASQSRAIAGYSGTEAAPPTLVTTPVSHGLATGDLITISGYGGIGNYNQSFEVSVASATSFTIATAFLDDDGLKGSWTPGRPFALNSSQGDEVWLLEADGSGNPVRFVDYVDFEASFDEKSLGRWPNGMGAETLVTMLSPTLDSDNDGPRVGPVVISELMYHPAGVLEEQLEFVEICNTGDSTENLAHWRLRGGADFEFTSSHELAPGAVLVMVSFDPLLDVAAVNNFRVAYGIDANVDLIGPFLDGPLRNDRGSVRLQRPDSPPPGQPGFFPAVTEDVVDYLSEDPWPSGAAGEGQSLTRSALSGFGRFAASWIAAPASPGSKAIEYAGWSESFFGPGAPAGSGPLDDVDLDGLFNLLEYALGLNPLVFDSDSPIEIEAGGGDLTLSYPKNNLLGGIVYRVEMSTDLVNWDLAPDQLVSVNGAIEMREVRVSMSDKTHLFLRLAIELQ